ncbi:MAG: type II secretion system protein GspC [Myxococcaceae bacterium]
MKPGRHLVLLGVVVLSLGALAAARVLSHVAHPDFVPVAEERPAPATAPPLEPPGPVLDAERLSRFTGVPAQPRQSLPPGATPARARSPVRARLLGTLIAADPAWSRAAVQELDSGRIRTVGVGDLLLDAQVIEIERARLLVLREGSLELIDPSAPTPAPSHLSAAPTRYATADLGALIRPVGEDRFEIPRSEVSRILANLHQLIPQARVVPSFRNGVADGFKVFAITPSSIYARLGIQNGDVIRKVNGYDVSTPESALDAYAKLKDASRIDVELGRGGATVRRSLQIL